MSDSQAVVIDNGSGVTKAGRAGDDKPSAVFPCIVGRPKSGSVIPGSENKDLYIADEAQKLRGVLNVSYPVEHGIVTNWEDMIKIWEHTIYNELRVEPAECSVMFTEAPMNPKANREQMIDIAFNTFNFKGFYVGIQAVLAMFSTGRTTGIVLDSGDGVTHAVPIYETYSVPHAVTKAMLAGRDVSAYLMKILTERGWNFETTAQFQIVRELKEKMCYASLDFKKDQEECNSKEWKEKFEKPYNLPDGNQLVIGSERYRATELMFQPTLVGKDVPGVHLLLYKSIMECDLDVRKSLWENVILSGGNTMFENYSDRLLLELKALAPAALSPKVIAQPDRKYAVFIGAAQLAGLSAFQNSWITRQEFDENGAGYVNRKCF
jgi:actin beta/gamma 1